MALFRKSEAYLGIDIGAGGIKLVELHKTKGRPQLWTYGIVEEKLDIHIAGQDKTPEQLLLEGRGEVGKRSPNKELGNLEVQAADPRIAHYADLLKELLKGVKVTTNRATVSLPVSYIFHTVLTLPFVDPKKRDAIVQAEVAKVLPRPIDQMQVVHQEMPQTAEQEEKTYIRLLVTAAPKSLVAFYTAIFQRAGLQLMELETEAFALERSLVGHDQATVMVVDIGSERTNFFIMDGGLPATHRSIQIGGNNIDALLQRVLGVEQGSVGQIKLDVSRMGAESVNAEIFGSVIDPIIKEINYGFALYLKQSGNENKRPEKIILTGGSAAFAPILDRVQASFDTKVFAGDPWARVVYQQGLKPILDEVGPRMAVSIGLALRNIV